MTNLQKNIDHYMELKGIKMYSHLLREIALQLGYRGQASYDFANREKANFSKTLKGERPLKYEYIIPLEKIFGVSLSRLMDEGAYKWPIDDEMIPFVKGIRYYARLDNRELYDNELAKLVDTEGKPIICGWDEYHKTFLDYIVEYGSTNGVRYLHDTYKIKLRFWTNQFDTEPKGEHIVLTSKTGTEFCRLVASMNDLKLFNDIYDSYYMFAMNGFYVGDILYTQDDFYEIVLDHEYLYKDLFEIKTYSHKLTPTVKKGWKREDDNFTFSSLNPVINGVLNYALRHLDKYRNQAIEILKFGIRHNEDVRKGLTEPNYSYHIDELGGIRENRTNDVVDIGIEVNEKNIQDKEIIGLIDRLPKFEKPEWIR